MFFTRMTIYNCKMIPISLNTHNSKRHSLKHWVQQTYIFLHHMLASTLSWSSLETLDPEEIFCKCMQPQFPRPDQHIMTTGTCSHSLDLTVHPPTRRRPQIPPFYRADVPGYLSFINRFLEPENDHLIPIDDYKEFLELAKIVLGGDV